MIIDTLPHTGEPILKVRYLIEGILAGVDNRKGKIRALFSILGVGAVFWLSVSLY